MRWKPQSFFVLYLFGLTAAVRWLWDPTTTNTTTTPTTPNTRNKISSTVSLESFTSLWTGVTSIDFTDGAAYAPRQTPCPNWDIVRESNGMSKGEADYIRKRRKITTYALKSFLSNVSNLTDFDADTFFASASRNISIALAMSGGGYRAMLCGAGQLMALDNRSEVLRIYGLGGLLQSSTYILGLSGGSWLVGTLVLNDWMSVEDVMNPELNIWNLDDTIFNPSGLNVSATASYYNLIRLAINAKEKAGFRTSVADAWGRALSHQFFNPNTTFGGGENVTWSGIQELDSFKNHTMPYPVVIADGRNPGTIVVDTKSTVFEITPHELGSWDPSLRAFADLKYLGTTINNGTAVKQCVTNYDNAGFILGTLSSLFNQVLVRVQEMESLNLVLKKIFENILSSFADKDADIALYEPNQFYNTLFGNLNAITSDFTLNLVDGGEDKQNIPIYPFIQPARDVDVIFAFDNSGDDYYNWPNGSSLVRTFERQFAPQGKGAPFPYVPPISVFVSEKFNEKPVFFGCSASNMSDLVTFHENVVNATDIPLVVYIPNTRYTYNSNTTTLKMSYRKSEMAGMVENGFGVATRGNFTDDTDWKKCIGCAIIRREQERRGIEQSKECKQCFENYCWLGGLKDTPALSISSLAMTQTLSLQLQPSGGSTLLSSSIGISPSSSLSRTSETSTTTLRANSGVVCCVFKWLWSLPVMVLLFAI